MIDPGRSVNIPRIFHHVWVSGDAMPESVVANRQSWIDRHPDWEFRVWRLEDLGWLRNRKLFDRSLPYSQKSDFARYEVVHRFGGVYLDTDMECLRPLDTLLAGCEFFAGREPNGKLGSAIFGAIPSHPITQEMIERLPASCYVHPIDQLSFTTGPMLLNRVLGDGGWGVRPGVRIFPRAYFYPYAGGETWRRDEPFPRAYAVHHWAHSWKDQPGVAVRPTDLLPPRGEAVMPSLRAVWREASGQLTTVVRQRVGNLAHPTSAHVRRILQRALPATSTPHGIPWGPGEVLVAAQSGVRLLCPTEDLSLSPELALTGAHDEAFADFLTRRLRWRMTFVDVGANVGLFTLLAASRVGPAGRVIAYECNPELVGFLDRNIEMSGLGDRVRMIPNAAHRDEEARQLTVPRHGKMLGTLTGLVGPDEQESALQQFEVGCERLDTSLREGPYVDLMRLDIEGGESAALDGLSGLLDDAKVGVIVMEYRDRVLSEELREDLEKQLTSFVQDRGASLHVPFAPRHIPLDEVLTVFDYPHLLICFPDASIDP